MCTCPSANGGKQEWYACEADYRGSTGLWPTGTFNHSLMLKLLQRAWRTVWLGTKPTAAGGAHTSPASPTPPHLQADDLHFCKFSPFPQQRPCITRIQQRPLTTQTNHAPVMWRTGTTPPHPTQLHLGSGKQSPQMDCQGPRNKRPSLSLTGCAHSVSFW